MCLRYSAQILNARYGGDDVDQVCPPEKDFFIDNLLVQIHLIIEMILVDRPCAMGVWIFFAR